MKVYKHTTAWDFLCEESWQCDSLKQAVFNAVNVKKLKLKLNEYVDEAFCNETYVSRTQLNDFLRFHSNDILKAIGLEDYI